jgi:hypothetical protein
VKKSQNHCTLVRGHSSSDSLRDLVLDRCLGGGDGRGRSFRVHDSCEKLNVWPGVGVGGGGCENEDDDKLWLEWNSTTTQNCNTKRTMKLMTSKPVEDCGWSGTQQHSNATQTAKKRRQKKRLEMFLISICV